MAQVFQRIKQRHESAPAEVQEGSRSSGLDRRPGPVPIRGLVNGVWGETKGGDQGADFLQSQGRSHNSMGIWAVPVPTSRTGPRPFQMARKSATKTALTPLWSMAS